MCESIAHDASLSGTCGTVQNNVHLEGLKGVSGRYSLSLLFLSFSFIVFIHIEVEHRLMLLHNKSFTQSRIGLSSLKYAVFVMFDVKGILVNLFVPCVIFFLL